MNGSLTANLRGNIAGDTKFYNFENDKSEVARFTVAMNLRRRQKDGTYGDKVLFWDVTVFGPDARYAHKIADGQEGGLKGAMFFGQGEVDFMDADNGKRYFTVLARDVAIITKGERSGPAPASTPADTPAETPAAGSAAPAGENPVF